MSTLFALLLWCHIGAGFLALGIFALPLATRKGGRAHTRAGTLYVWAMGAVSLSATAMVVLRVLGLVTRGSGVDFSLFLLFIAVLSAVSVLYGVRVFRFKTRKKAHRHPFDLGIAVLLLASGGAMSIYGFSVGKGLLSWFPLIGVALGAGQLAYWLRAPRLKQHAWFEHMTGMFSGCISTVTAFVVFGAPRLLGLERAPWMLWIAPSLVLVPILMTWQAVYRRRFERSSRFPLHTDAAERMLDTV